MYRQSFTSGGMWGAILFVLSPITVALGYWLAFVVSAAPAIGAILLLVGGGAFWLSVPMMLIGREYMPSGGHRLTDMPKHSHTEPKQQADAKRCPNCGTETWQGARRCACGHQFN